jgi:NADP-dependent 3-hydroxy acid dehydrogenase YdfG
VAAASLTPQHAQKFMPLIFYTMLGLVQEFLPHMLEQGDGPILTAQGGSTVQGLPNMSGPSPAQAAQRNYLQALHAEVADKGVRRRALHRCCHQEQCLPHRTGEEQSCRRPGLGHGYRRPRELADLLWTMHSAKGQRETIYPWHRQPRIGSLKGRSRSRPPGSASSHR